MIKSESEVTQSCLTLCDPMTCSLPDSSVRGILQARILEWVAFPSPNYYDTYQQMALTMILIKSILTSGIWRIWTVTQKIGSRKSIIWWREESQHCYFFIRLQIENNKNNFRDAVSPPEKSRGRRHMWLWIPSTTFLCSWTS